MTQKRTNPVILSVLWLGSMLYLAPLLLVLIVSFTDEKSVLSDGYSFLPGKWSLSGYKLLLSHKSELINAYGITLFVTFMGTLLSLVITSMLAYPLSRRELPYRKAIVFYVLFTLLFNGGLLPWYLVYTAVIDVRHSIWSLIIPNLLMNGFNVLLMRAYLESTISPSIVESAYLDGAGELKIFLRIILPLSMPIMAIVGMLVALTYWNDWYNSLVFSNYQNVNIQTLFRHILFNVQFLFPKTEDGPGPSLVEPLETTRMAFAVIATTPFVLVYPFFQKYFIKGLRDLVVK